MRGDAGRGGATPVEPTPVGGVARAVLWADLVVTIVAGLALYALARRADTDFAWTIAAPITAAFLGAGYWGSAVSIALALRASEWARVRILFVTGFVLTALVLVPTFVYVDELHLDDGSGTARAFAWIWVALYLVQPWVLLAVFVARERAGGAGEYAVERPLAGWFRAAVLAHAVGLTVVAVALWPLRLDGFWPWEMPDIGAAAVATWLVTFASGSWWCLRDGDWARVRLVFPAYLAFLALTLVATIRFGDALDGGRFETWALVGAVVASFAVLGAGALAEERRRRG